MGRKKGLDSKEIVINVRLDDRTNDHLSELREMLKMNNSELIRYLINQKFREIV